MPANEFFCSVLTQNDLGVSPLGQQKPRELSDRRARKGTEMLLALDLAVKEH